VTVRRILAAGAVTAVADGAFAVSLCYIYAPTCLPLRTFQGIAAGVLSREPAIAGGLATAALGLVLHLFIATGWATLYGVLYQQWVALRRLTATAGGTAIVAVAFGCSVWLAMNRLIVPLSYARTTPLFTQVWWVVLLGHPFAVGLPIVGIVREPRSVPV
jgi:type IV secretory pathway TrbD component